MKIKTVPASILYHKIDDDVLNFNSKIKRICEKMTLVLYESNGIGLSAPQVGISLRIFLVNWNNRVREFINPKIIKHSIEKEEMEEGCLSIPGILSSVERSKRIEIEAYDVRGKMVTLKLDGMLARIAQHECDHLDGILFWDRLPYEQKEYLQKEYMKR